VITSRGPRCAVAAGLLVVALVACRDDGGSAASFCQAVAEDEGISTTFQGFDPSDPEAALDQLRTARVTLGEVRDAAPGEVRDDLDVEIAYADALIDALEPVAPGDASEATLQVQSVTDAHPQVDEAAAALAAFAERECSET
jgi:hypothetical protein